jgi:hypothetical protein
LQLFFWKITALRVQSLCHKVASLTCLVISNFFFQS